MDNTHQNLPSDLDKISFVKVLNYLNISAKPDKNNERLYAKHDGTVYTFYINGNRYFPSTSPNNKVTDFLRLVLGMSEDDIAKVESDLNPKSINSYSLPDNKDAISYPKAEDNNVKTNGESIQPEKRKELGWIFCIINGKKFKLPIYDTSQISFEIRIPDCCQTEATE
jgi:hypothetical protein